MGDPTAHIVCMCKGTGYEVRGEDPGAVVETGDNRETAESHGRRYFGGNKGAATTGIRQAWKIKERF